MLELLAERLEDPDVNYQCAWVHDLLGLEREAIPFYERAIEEGLTGRDLKEATTGLGSSYRCLAGYERAVEVLRDGAERFPNSRAVQMFLAVALYNAGEHREGMGLLLRNLVETTDDEGVAAYREAILYYSDRLDETW